MKPATTTTRRGARCMNSSGALRVAPEHGVEFLAKHLKEVYVHEETENL